MNAAADVRGRVEYQPAEARLLSSAATGKGWLLGLLLAAATILAYQPAWHAGFVWDDDVYVTENPLLTAPDGLWRIWFSLDSPSQYFPITYTTFRLERALWGLNPAGYHWVNILLHAANALLLWRLLKRLHVPGAWLAAAIFALHPVHVESVAWITERKNVLSLFFMLLSLLTWVEFLENRLGRASRLPVKRDSSSTSQTPAMRAGGTPALLWYGLALGFYALALFAKTTACTLPAALLLIWWWKERPAEPAERLDVRCSMFDVRCSRRLAQIVPFLILGAGLGLLTMWWERHHQLTQGKLFEFGFLDRVLIASRAVWFYAGKLFWPADLCFSYPRWTIDSSNPLAYGWLVALVGLGVAIFYARRFLGRGLEVAVLFFVATLSPMLGFITLYTFAYTFVADHYQYVASIGLIALAAAGVSRWMKFEIRNSKLEGSSKAETRSTDRAPFGFRISSFGFRVSAAGALLAALGILTWRQCATYTDSETLWRATLERNPDSILALVNLGSDLSQRGELDGAIVHFERALTIQPDDAVANYSLGNTLLQKGRLDEALVLFQKAAVSDPRDPVAQYDLGVGLFQKGRPGEAIESYRRAIALQPDYGPARFNLGIALFQNGDVDEAIIQFRRVLEVHRDSADAHYNLALALSVKGRIKEAAHHFSRVVELQPDHVDALNNLAWVLATSPEPSLRNGARAVELAERAARFAGSNSMVLDTLAAAYAEAGRFPEALDTAQTALAWADAALADALQARARLYQARAPFRDNSQTNAHAQPYGP